MVSGKFLITLWSLSHTQFLNFHPYFLLETLHFVFNQHAWKAFIVATLSRVRIPLSPTNILIDKQMNND